MKFDTIRLNSLLVIGGVVACSHAAAPAPAVPNPAPVAHVEQEVAKPPAYVPGPSAETIRRAVDSRQADLRQCYMAGTFKNSDLRGTIEVVFTIETDGRVSDAQRAKSDLKDEEVVECVLSVFASLQFPKGGTSVTEVTYPVTFGSHG